MLVLGAVLTVLLCAGAAFVGAWLGGAGEPIARSVRTRVSLLEEEQMGLADRLQRRQARDAGALSAQKRQVETKAEREAEQLMLEQQRALTKAPIGLHRAPPPIDADGPPPPGTFGRGA